MFDDSFYDHFIGLLEMEYVLLDSITFPKQNLFNQKLTKNSFVECDEETVHKLI